MGPYGSIKDLKLAILRHFHGDWDSCTKPELNQISCSIPKLPNAIRNLVCSYCFRISNKFSNVNAVILTFDGKLINDDFDLNYLYRLLNDRSLGETRLSR